MKTIPLTPETEALARRLVWFEEPEAALVHPIRFLAYALEHATHEDMVILSGYLTEADLGAELEAAPPGIISGRFRSDWNATLLGRFPPPPQPQRRFTVSPPRRAPAPHPPAPSSPAAAPPRAALARSTADRRTALPRASRADRPPSTPAAPG